MQFRRFSLVVLVPFLSLWPACAECFCIANPAIGNPGLRPLVFYGYGRRGRRGAGVTSHAEPYAKAAIVVNGIVAGIVISVATLLGSVAVAVIAQGV
jgi:hypothetical protein